MSKSLSLTNSKDIICNSIALIVNNDIINLTDLFLLKTTTINAIISAEDLKKNNELIDLLNNNTNDDGNKFAEFAENITKLINDKASIIYVNNELNKKINSIDVYTNTQISKLLFLKSNKDESYTIENTNNLFYNKTAVDDQLNKKINSIDVYTNTQISKLLFLKADKDKSLTTLEIENLYYNKIHINSELSKKIDSLHVYTTTQMDKSLFLKINKSDALNKIEIDTLYYTKAVINEQLNLKGNSVDLYTKPQVLELLKLKSNKSESLTKAEIENAYFTKEFIIAQLNLKSDIIYTNNTFYNKTYLNNVFNNIYNKIQLDNILKEYYNKEIILNYYNKTALDNLKLVSQSKLDELFVNYDSIIVNNEKLNKKSNLETTYTKTEANAYVIIKLESYYNKTEIVDNFVNKTLLNTYYNKEEIDLIENKFYLKGSIDSKLNLKANLENTYSKSNIDEILKSYNKVDQSNNYSKDEINNMLLLKLDKTTIDNYFNKTQIINSLDLKLDKTTIDNYFTKLEINTTLELKLDKSTISSYYSKSNIDQILINFYNKKEVDDKNTISYNNLIEQINLKATLLNTYSKSNIDEILKNYNKNSDFYTKDEANNLLNLKFNITSIDNYFNKPQVINSLNLKLDKTTIDEYYTIIKSNELLALKFNNSDISNYYSKSNIDEILKNSNNSTQQSQAINLKLDKTAIDAYYSKIENNKLLDLKLNSSNIINYYSKSNIDQILINYYDKTEINSKSFITLSALNNYYTKTTLDSLQIVGQPKLDEELSKKLDISGGSIIGSPNNTVTRFSVNNTNKGNVYSSLELKADVSFLEIAVGPNIAGIGTKSNNKMVFTTNIPVNTHSISIEANGTVNFFYDIYNNAITYLKNTFIDGLLKVPQIETTNTYLKLKGGTSGTQILDTNDIPIINISPYYIYMSKNVDINNSDVNSILSIKNNTSNAQESYATLYLKCNTAEGKIQVGFDRLMIGTNTTNKIIFAVNTNSTNVIPMTIQSNGDVNISTKFTNTSDSKLKDNQQNASLDDIQNIFNNINVKTYQRNDLNMKPKRCGFIAQDVESAVNNYEYFQNLVGSSTIQREENGLEEDIKTLDYARLTTILWGALKNSNQKIEDLEQRMKSMETK